MISKNLLNSLEQAGFTYHDSKNSANTHAYAIYGGYLVTVYESLGKKIVYFNFKFSENDENDLKRYDMSEKFSSHMEEFSVTDYDIDEDGMRVVSEASVFDFLKLIDYCVEILTENEIRGIGYCSQCGNKFGSRNPKKVTCKNENHLMCEHCAIAAIEESNKAQNEPDIQPGNTGKGIIGAVIGGLVGLFLYFALYYWLSPALSDSGINEVRYIFCVCGFITSFLVYAGYRLLCKKISAGAYITVAVSSVVFTLAGQYIGSVFEYFGKNNFSLKLISNKVFWLIHLRCTIPEDLADQFTDNSAIFFKLLIFSMLFAVIGAAIFLLSLHDKTLQKNEPVEVETIAIE